MNKFGLCDDILEKIGKEVQLIRKVEKNRIILYKEISRNIDVWKGLEIEKLVESERFTYNISTWQYEEGTFLFFFFDGDDDCYFHRSYWFEPNHFTKCL